MKTMYSVNVMFSLNWRSFTLSAICLFLGTSLGRTVVLDEFLSTGSVAVVTDSGSSGIVTLEPGTSGNALQLAYGLGAGNYVVMTRSYISQDLAMESGNTVRFRYKATGNSNTLETKFTDFDSSESIKSDKLDFKILTIPDNQWRTWTVHLSSFALFPDGNSSFDLSRVTRMTFGFTTDNSTRASGTVLIDKLELLRSTYTLVDDFNDASDPNFFGGTSNLSTNAAKAYLLDGTRKVLEWEFRAGPPNQFAFLTLGLANKNFQGYTHISFKIRGAEGGEMVKAKFESPLGQTEVLISNFLSAITTTYQDVSIPLSNFPDVNFSSVTVFTLVSGNSFGTSSGTIFLDDLAFTCPGQTAGVVRVLDEMDADFPTSNWDIYTHADAALNVSVVSDPSSPDASGMNRVYRLEYKFSTTPSQPAVTPYAVIERPLELYISPYQTLRFKYKGTGSANNLEFKLVDDDNTFWFKKLFMATDTGGTWKNATIGVNELAFFSAGRDTALDLRKIQRVEFAISKGSGGSGTVAFDLLEGFEPGQMDASVTKERLVSGFRMVNNPFSPNNDGIRDEVFLIYSLASPSKVSLSIYSLEGDLVRSISPDIQSAGDQSLSWNGRSNVSSRVNNGLYILRLEAEGLDNRKDEVKQIIGVVR